MIVERAATNNCLLDYSIDVAPSPLQVSPQSGNPSIAALTLVVSNGSDSAIYCDRIIFSIPVGELAQDLTTAPEGILVAAQPSGQWQIVSGKDGTFTATPVKPEFSKITTDGLVFRLYSIQVNKKVGTFALTVDEHSSLDGTNFRNLTNSYKLPKFPYEFFMSNFTADKPMVDNGGRATLTWSGSDNATYTILYDNENVDVTGKRAWPTPPLHHMTNFILKAMVQHDGETVWSYLNTVVAVSNPELTATALTVLQGSILKGSTTVGVQGSNADLSVTGDVKAAGSLSGANITTGGKLTANGGASLGPVTATGLTAGNTQVNGTLGVTGTSTTADLTVNGRLKAAGAVGMMGAAQPLGSGSYRASSDGIVLGWVKGAGDVKQRCLGLISGGTSAFTVRAMGGNTQFRTDVNWIGACTYWYWLNDQNLAFPVRQDEWFSVSAYYPPDNEVNPTCGFVYVPFGAGRVALAERVGDAPEMAVPAPVKVVGNDGTDPAAELVRFFDSALPVHLSGEQRENLARLLRELTKQNT